MGIGAVAGYAAPSGHARQLKDSGHLIPMRRIFGVRWLDTAFPGGGAALPRAR